MQRKTILKLCSGVVSAAVLMTSIPVSMLAKPSETGKAKAEKKEENLLKLWYDESAIEGAAQAQLTAENDIWEQYTLPIGNSFMGANVYGEIVNERLTFNQKTLWNGGPSESRPNYNGGNNANRSGAYQEVVNAFIAGDIENAETICGQQLVGISSGYGEYQSWGDLYLTFQNLNADKSTNYERNLDLTTGIANVDFTIGDTDYHREYFVSYPDNVLAMKLTATKEALDFNVRFPADNDGLNENQKKVVAYETEAASNAGTIVMAGHLPDNQMKMNSMLKVETDGTVTEGEDGESLNVAGAGEVIIYISADTDYKNQYPHYRSGETDRQLAESVAKDILDASEMGFEIVKDRHLTDYQRLFGRVTLDIGQTFSEKTTDELLTAYKTDATLEEKKLYEALLYQYGRYLTIASSREGDLPSNLQGVWQNRTTGIEWGSDYHMNVNLQMNYWPTYSSNLSECAIPLIEYVDSLRTPGRVTAESYFGIESRPGEANGFSAHTQNTPFGWTCPGWSFDWGWSPAAVPWILQNCWEYYEYTGDVEYMRKNLYPMLREEAILYDQILIDSGVKITLEDGTESTRLVSAPAYSPEWGERTLGNVYENSLIWQLYEDAATAADILGVDEDLAAHWRENQSRLSPIEIGDSGQIKEWFDETTVNPGQHRHMSHLLGLYPGDLIAMDNEEWREAAQVSLGYRGFTGSDIRGWAYAQRMCAWARTGDEAGAYKALSQLIKIRIYPNLWDTHPPFQIDGNFGYTAGINEMLMQSNLGYINILPALPKEWSSGCVDGILARGNFELKIDWTDGSADLVEVTSKNGGECIVQYKGIENAVVKDSKGAVIPAKKAANNRISFATEKGKMYTITGFSSLKAPTGVKAENDNGNIVLTWDAAAGAASYHVYRKAANSYEKIGTTANLTYTDAGRVDFAEAEKYYVAAVSADGKEGEHSEIISIKRPIRWVDNTDEEIEYNGNWGTWSDSKHYGGSIHFVETLTGDETIEFAFKGTGIDVIAPKNSGRYGELKVYIDEEEAGIANCNSDSSLAKQVVFSKQDLEDGTHTIKLTAEGQSGRKIEFDAFTVYEKGWENIPEINVSFDLEKTPSSGSAPAAQTVLAGSSIILPACSASVTDYRFAGWNDGKKVYAANREYKVLSADMTFTAVWERTAQNVTKIETDDALTLNSGEKRELQVTVEPAGITKENLKFTSSDLSVASVSPKGTIAASKYKSGTAVITISSADKTVTKQCTVTVNPPAAAAVTEVSLEKDRIVLKKEDTTSLVATVTPYFGTEKNIAWSVDDSSVAEVNEDGVITGKAVGKATVTATANGKSDSCEVYVVEHINVSGRQELLFTLQTLKDLAEKYQTDEYDAQIAEIEKLLENGDALLQTEIEESITKIEEAETILFKKDFNLAITNADKLNLNGYTAGSVQAVRDALEKAKTVQGKENATFSEMKAAMQKLEEAISSLVPDKGVLTGRVETAKKKDLSKYTDNTVKRFQQAISMAEAVLNNKNATKTDIQNALKELEDAEKALTEKGGGQVKKPVSALNALIEDANLQYTVTKSDAVNGTVTVSGVTAAGKKKASITIPATVVKDGYSFKVTAINKNVFKGCKKKLKSVVIGANVTEIGANSFNKCSKLKSIRFMNAAAPKKVGKNAFKGIKSTCKIFYPKSMNKSELKKLKKKMKSAGKKAVYKKK